MQGQRGAIGFEQGSTSSDAGVVDQQICWENIMQNSPSDYMSANANDMFLNPTNEEGQNMSLWTVGEAGSSSVSNPVSHGHGHSHSHIEPRTDRGWPSLMKSCPEPPSGMLSLGDHSSSVSVPHDGAVNQSSSIGFKPSNSLETYCGSGASSSSFSDPFGPSASDHFELGDRRLSRKRKAVELSVGQSSSGIGSSNMFQGPDGGSSGSNMWHSIAENPNNPDPTIPRLGLGVGTLSSETPIVENAHRNVQLRLSSSHRQHPSAANHNNRQSDVSSIYPSLRLNPVDFRSPPATGTPENSSTHQDQGQVQGQPALRIPLRRNIQSTSRWSRNSTSRANRSSNLVISGERNELDSRTMPNISDHPLFAQPSDARNALPTDINWTSNGGGGGGGSTSNAGNGVATSSRAGQGLSPAPSSAPPNPTAHRYPPHYHPRRLSAFLRRSLLSATDSEAGTGQNSNLFPRIPPSVTTSSSSQDLGIPPVVSIQGHHHHQQPHLRSSALVGRQLEGGALGIPYLSRSGNEGRGRLVSEIRNVLDLMRRGEPLRFEDIMILDQSVLYGIADIHDRHRDMRLDIDNMSYEELLALEERIGNVNTGLTEEKISKHLKQKQYVAETGQPETEPCCVCQEEYKDGDDVGMLECGHDFHHGCIKQWLQQKNSCPICKSTGLAKAAAP